MIKILYTLAVTLVMVGQAPFALAQEKLRLAWAGFSPTNSPIWVIEDRKLMQKQGVTPEIIAISASLNGATSASGQRNRRRQYFGHDANQSAARRRRRGDDRRGRADLRRSYRFRR